MAGSKSIGSMFAELSLRDNMTKGLAKAGAAIKTFGKASVAFGAASTAAMGAAMVAGTKRTLDQVDALGDLSSATGIAVADLMGLQQAYKEGGLSAEKVGADVSKMQKAISDASEGDKIGDTFKELGLDVARLMEMDPADQFETIGKAIMGVDNMAKRVAAARDIFGKSGSGLLAVFENVEEARQSLGKMPEIAERFAVAMGRANDLIGRLPNKSDQFFTGFTSGIVGQMLPQLEKTNKFDFTELGQNMGRALGTGFQGLLDGSLVDIISLRLAGGLIDAAEKFTSALQAGVYAAVESIRTIGGRSFTEAFQHAVNVNVMAAGGGPRGKMATGMFAEADRLWNELQKKNQVKEGAAASMSDLGSAAEPPAAAMPAKFQPDRIQEKQTDEYIKRGLMVGQMASPKAKVEEDQLSELKQIKVAIIRPYAPNGTPLF